MNTAVQTRAPNPVNDFRKLMEGYKGQMAAALPKHLTADRMARLAISAFSSNPDLQLCTTRSIVQSMMLASTLGLEPGVNGQGYLIPYKGQCTFVPGWKGLVDIANRSGRVSVWTGCVFQGDHFEYALGDTPFIKHQPGEEDSDDKITHVYAVGRVNGSNWPVIEVWPIGKVARHRNKYNKVGQRHYSFKNWEMYARKIPLMQVLKYMPASIELQNALAASNAEESGRGVVIDGNFVTVDESAGGYYGDDGAHDDGGQADQGADPAQGAGSAPRAAAAADNAPRNDLPFVTPEAFEQSKAPWMAMVKSGKKNPNTLIAFIESRELLSDDMRMEIASWAVPTAGAAA